MTKIRETTLEIDLQALAHNYSFLRAQLHPNTKFMAVIKAYAYGSSAKDFAEKLAHLGVDYLAVAYVNEGIRLRKAGIQTPILVLHPQSTHFEDIITHRLTPTIYSPFVLEAFTRAAESAKEKAYPMHLKLNTGLNRLGFDATNILYAGNFISTSTAVKVEGVFSHLAASEDPAEKAFTQAQISTFKTLSAELIAKIGYHPLRHLCNTSGIFNYPEAHFDMVRSGIGLHGYGNAPEIDAQLRPTATLKTIISQIHHIKKGESVSYNRQFIAEKDTTTATLPLGHADGINRIYGKSRGFVEINNQKAPIIGNVCMDMVMVDITGIACQEGDEVLVFGQEKSAEDLANAAGTISYELLTSISQRVKRVTGGG